ncbi:MAG: TlpA family protein disulfide reductase [Cryomorphaceae bacterium]|nr:TlpA family protein disulfide reductase [Cryomorphaceae bacterium]
MTYLKKRPLLFILIAAFAMMGLGFVANSTSEQSRVGTRIGDIAPELEFPSPDGKKIKLSSLRGKLVLIDFWASWCQPCRVENPNLVKLYDKYNGQKKVGNAKGFEIYSVSLDQDHSRWVAAIEQDGLRWKTHVSDLKFWKSEAARIYGVGSIPNAILIDENGVIIGKGLRGPAIEMAIRNYINQ